jgi:putative Ca2+/H+ antiporter (TMEM165/GDT1 family)
VYFGVKLLKEASESTGGPSEELHEVEEEIRTKKDTHTEESPPESTPSRVRPSKSAPVVEVDEKEREKDDDYEREQRERSRRANVVKVVTQAFSLTFLAEWGDRSQIATIALAAAKDPLGVMLGGIVGHALCTSIAVVGGRMLAARISERTVALVGGILFIAFALHSFCVGP